MLICYKIIGYVIGVCKVMFFFFSFVGMKGMGTVYVATSFVDFVDIMLFVGDVNGMFVKKFCNCVLM